MIPDKRLKFRRVEPKFNSRNAAIQYVSELTVNPELFGEGLYGEPIVAKYTENGKDLLLLAVGVENGKSYHIIDTYGLELDIARIERDIANLNSGSTASYSELIERIIAEEERAQAAEDELATTVNSINTEVEAISDSLEDFKNEVPETYATKTYVDEGLALVEGELNQLENEIPETYATKEFVTNEVSAINSAITNVATSLTELEDEIPNVYSTKEQVDSAVTIINSAITTLDTTITELEQEIPETYATIEYVDNGLDTINSALAQHIADCESDKIADVVYENDYVKLTKNDGTKTDGFALGPIINRSIISSIEYDPTTKKLIIVYGDSYDSRVEIPLSDLADMYSVGDNSLTYLKITQDNKIEAIVNNSGYQNTLATTDYVESGIGKAVVVSKGYTDNKISEEKTNILNHTDAQDHDLYRLILANSGSIATLWSDCETDGSVKHTIDDALIAIPTNVNVEDAYNVSLIRKVEGPKGPEYFVTNSAEYMNCVIGGESYNLNTYIASLHGRIKYLESVIGTITEPVGNLETIIKDTVRNYLKGKDFEIEIAPIEDGRYLQIRFPDDAIFGPDPLRD